MALQTRNGVAGMSSSWMPSGDKASSTAFMIVCGAAMQPACPVPFTPSGFDRVGSEYVQAAGEVRQVLRARQCIVQE